MARYNSEGLVLDTYQAVVSAYSDFLTVAIHTILYERNIYPQTSFLKARKYNFPVRQSRHPKVCKWIQDAVAAVEAEMLKCTVATTSLIIHAPPPHCTPLERYVFSTAAFPRIPPSEILTPFAPADTPPQPITTTTTTTNPEPEPKPSYPIPPTSNLPEQFRATLTRLTTSLSLLSPLPYPTPSSASSPSSTPETGTAATGYCSFTLAIELREDSEEGISQIPPPIGREEEKKWIVAEPGWQRDRGRDRDRDHNHGSRDSHSDDNHQGKGKYLGGSRTTPIRKLEAGAFQMECWVEEGRGKFRAGVEDAAEGDEE